MGELTLREKIVHMLWKPWVWTQCKHLSGCAHDTTRYYCLRRIGHFGPHRFIHGGSDNP